MPPLEHRRHVDRAQKGIGDAGGRSSSKVRGFSYNFVIAQLGAVALEPGFEGAFGQRELPEALVQPVA